MSGRAPFRTMSWPLRSYITQYSHQHRGEGNDPSEVTTNPRNEPCEENHSRNKYRCDHRPFRSFEYRRRSGARLQHNAPALDRNSAGDQSRLHPFAHLGRHAVMAVSIVVNRGLQLECFLLVVNAVRLLRTQNSGQGCPNAFKSIYHRQDGTARRQSCPLHQRSCEDYIGPRVSGVRVCQAVHDNAIEPVKIFCIHVAGIWRLLRIVYPGLRRLPFTAF